MSLPIYQEEKITPSTQEEDPLAQEKKQIQESLAHIPKKIAIYGAKGGVGTTFLSTQLALLLQEAQKKVGLLDADISCPNVASALQIAASAEMSTQPDNTINPYTHHSIELASSSFFVKQESLAVRGVIKHTLFTDFITRVNWSKDLDVFLIDVESGTSDIALATMQLVELTGMILVSTPDKQSIQDTKRAIHLAKRLAVPILGIVENMSGEVYGTGTVRKLAENHHISFICSIPFSKEIQARAQQAEIAITNYADTFVKLVE